MMKKQLPLLAVLAAVMLFSSGCTLSDVSALIQLISFIAGLF